MKWSGLPPRIRVRRSQAYHASKWGFLLERSRSYGPGLRLLIRLGSAIHNIYLTWPRRRP